MGAATFAVVALVIGLILHVKKSGKKVVPWLMLIAGAGIAGGVIGRLIDRVSASGVRGVSSASARLFGAGVPILLAVGMGIVLFIHMKPKGQPPTRFTPWLALIFPAVLMATGGVLAGLGAFAGQTATEFGTAAFTMLSDLTRGR